MMKKTAALMALAILSTYQDMSAAAQKDEEIAPVKEPLPSPYSGRERHRAQWKNEQRYKSPKGKR